ncbi:MAG TPA: M20 family metallopeptidase [Pyrinomonadaceae bacterium]|nr:M20 family metallopeptidase [Pyrinomonadaceae bacterium]
MKPQEILDYFESRETEILEKIEALVEIESPSGDLEGNRNAVDFLTDEAREISLDFEIERVFAEDYGEHFILRAFPSDEKPILLLGHTDTVHPRGAKERNPTRVEDGKLYGCGTFDMKAGCVLMLEALRFFSESNLKPPRPITILLSCDEEIGSFSGRELVEREATKAEFCLICEPSANGKVKTGRKGTGMFRLKTYGIPAHAGLDPEKGASAILEISKQIEKLHALNKLEEGTTVNVCTIAGGTTTNVIPAEAECSIDVRFKTLAEAERIEKEIKSLIPFDNRVSLEILGAVNRPPLERTKKIIALYEKAREIAQSINYELGETEVGGASDGNFVGALGVPVLDGLGVKGDGAHTLHEHIWVEDVPKRAALLALLLLAK